MFNMGGYVICLQSLGVCGKKSVKCRLKLNVKSLSFCLPEVYSCLPGVVKRLLRNGNRIDPAVRRTKVVFHFQAFNIREEKFVSYNTFFPKF